MATPRPSSPIDWAARLDAARRLAAPCALCELRCGVDRLGDERGRCGLGATTPIYGQMLSLGEERALSPSWLVDLSGCSMHCTFCSEDRHLRPPFAGTVIAAEALARHLAEVLPAQRRAARNINFVGGEPSISLPYLLEVAHQLELVWPAHPPLLLNTNGYLTADALALCRDVFDLFVVDLKFGPGACGWKIGKVAHAFEVVTARLATLARWPSAELWVRHLVMPGHLECCTRPVLDWLARELPEATVNVMANFVAFAGTRAAEHWTALSPQELAAARDLLAASDLPRALWNGGPPIA